MEELSELVENRLRRIRGRLGPAAYEVPAGAALDDVGEGAAVLVVGWSDQPFEVSVEWYGTLRARLAGRSAVHVLAPIVEDIADRAEGFRARVKRRGAKPSYRPRHVVGALRQAGWTVGDIERFEDADGVIWADIVAHDLELDVG